MTIYTKGRESLDVAFDKSGNALQYAYNKEGETVFALNRKPLKVMTYNVGQWYLGNHDNVPTNLDAEYYALQNGIIQRNNADILLIEEYTKQFSKTGRTALSLLEQYYPYIIERGGDNPSSASGVYCCVCSKFPITDYETHLYSDNSGFYYDSCTITIDGTPVYVVVTHLHWNNRSYRGSEALQLLSAVKDKPYVIIGGDFNTGDCFSTSGLDYVAVVKPFVDAGFNVGNCSDFGFIKTYGSGTDEVTHCLDNIITSSNFPILSAYIDTTKITDEIVEKIDHVPFVGIIKLV